MLLRRRCPNSRKSGRLFCSFSASFGQPYPVSRCASFFHSLDIQRQHKCLRMYKETLFAKWCAGVGVGGGGHAGKLGGSCQSKLSVLEVGGGGGGGGGAGRGVWWGGGGGEAARAEPGGACFLFRGSR